MIDNWVLNCFCLVPKREMPCLKNKRVEHMRLVTGCDAILPRLSCGCISLKKPGLIHLLMQLQASVDSLMILLSKKG